MKKLMLFVPADLLLKLFWSTLFLTWNQTQSSSSGLLGLAFLWGFSLAERLIKADLQKTSIWSFKSKCSAFHQTISEKGSSFWQTVTNTSSSFFTWIFFLIFSGVYLFHVPVFIQGTQEYLKICIRKYCMGGPGNFAYKRTGQGVFIFTLEKNT